MPPKAFWTKFTSLVQKPLGNPETGFSKPIITLKDTTVEWPKPVDCPLTREVDYLWLEVRSNGRVVDRIPVFAVESCPGVWSAEGRLVRPKTSAEFMIFVYMTVYETKRRLLGFVKLNGPDFYEGLDKVHEIPLVCRENAPKLILKTRILGQKSIQNFFSSIIWHNSYEDAGIPIEMIHEDAVKAYRDFQQRGNLESLEQAIEHLRYASKIAAEGDSDGLVVLTDLGICLRSRFERLWKPADIDESIARLEGVVNLTPNDHPEKSRRLHALGLSFNNRFERHGNMADINNAIECQQRAVDLAPDDDPEKPNRLNSLGTSLLNRFKRCRDLVDLDNAIAANQIAVNLAPDDHRDKSMYSSNLAIFLDYRFNWLGNSIDMDDAIASSQDVVRHTADGDPDKPSYLSILGNCLETRFKRTNNLVDLENAIKSKQAAVDLTPDDHPQKPMYLHNLGLSLHLRFKQLGNLADLMDSIMLYQAAVDLAPDDHPNKADYLNGLGISLDSRFQCLGNLSDLDRAIITNQAAVNLTPEDHPSKRLCLIGLASAYWSRFRHLSLPDDAETTITLLSSASNSQTGSPVHRFTAATTWISFASFNGHPSLLAAYESAITIMPLVAWLGLSISNRHQRLREIGGITQDAAAAAISLEQYDKALEWLDQGRSIVWNQILQLRTPVDELCDIRPDLAERLFQVSRVLDQGPGQAGPSTLGKESVEEAGRRYRALTTERESLIEQVRSLPKFESFMMPLKSSQLMKSVQDGVVIVLNVAKERCDALTLIPGKDAISHIPLPNITSKRVRELGTELRSLSHSTGIRRRGEHSVIHVEEAHEEHCRQILAELWTTLVKPILDSLNFSPRPLTLPRIWWCATGPLAFLPIHAAGIYNSGSLDDQLSNYAISSYIPTVSTLLGRHNPAVHSSTFRMLSVVQPSAPGTPSIPRTKEELACVKRRLVGQSHVILEGKEGTKARVVKRMKECNWLHLSCHGVQDLEEPTRSALILEDGHLTLEEIIKLDLPNAQFAFLSACQTSSGDEKLSEEAVHIAGGMLLAGYRGVVATMWSIQDELAPEVADKFYAYLMQDEQEPDSRRAAEALHFAIQELRQKRSIPFISWVPFVHLGA